MLKYLQPTKLDRITRLESASISASQVAEPARFGFCHLPCRIMVGPGINVSQVQHPGFGRSLGTITVLSLPCHCFSVLPVSMAVKDPPDMREGRNGGCKPSPLSYQFLLWMNFSVVLSTRAW